MTKTSKLLAWIDARFPLSDIWNKQMAQYYAPKNLNFWYFFGVLSLVVLVNQILTGIWLAMSYVPTADEAFNSIQHISREVRFGWLLRYMHTVGASAFFIVIYLHMYRAVIYGSFKKPRELLWVLGMVLYVLLVTEAFSGYVLPWGQMSYWAVEVIGSLFKAIPLIGGRLAIWMEGDYHVSGVALHRLFAFHVTAIPMIIVIFVILHLIALRMVGSNNPDGIEIKAHLDKQHHPLDGVPFNPYFSVKDLFGIAVFLCVFAAIVFFEPTFHGYFLEPENSLPANPLVTPEHIRPVWYLAPFYGILRAIPNKMAGIFLMASAIAILFVLPWLDRSPVKSIRYKGWWSKLAILVLLICFIGLGVLGTLQATPGLIGLARLFTVGYFAFFLLMPFYTYYEKTAKAPTRVTR
ncbi:MAG: cytochrome bc complex cytochrome b subunit [Gammaproteobacteria bacterium]